MCEHSSVVLQWWQKISGDTLSGAYLLTLVKTTTHCQFYFCTKYVNSCTFNDPWLLLCSFSSIHNLSRISRTPGNPVTAGALRKTGKRATTLSAQKWVSHTTCFWCGTKSRNPTTKQCHLICRYGLGKRFPTLIQHTVARDTSQDVEGVSVGLDQLAGRLCDHSDY